MTITHPRRRLRAFARFVAAAALWLIAPSPLLAAPLAFSGGSAGGADFAWRLDQAADLLRRQALEAPACRAYFERLGVDLDAWLAPDAPPRVVARRLDFAAWRGRGPVCGGAQGRPPFELLFIDPRCFRGRQVCELASLLLHEMGHLARRDTRDHEPPEFFAVCRLSACVDPARYD